MSRCYLRFVIVAFCVCAKVIGSAASNGKRVCDHAKRARDVHGVDVVIGGLIPVHVHGDLNLPGVMWAEAMMYAIDEINADPSLLPGIKLGYDIRDSCNMADIAVRSALDFLLTPKKTGTYKRKFDNKTHSSCLCNKDAHLDNSPPVVAVVGGASSSISAVTSTIFSVDNVPQISYSSTSPTLSNKLIYRSFLRTIPSDVYQAEAIADILVHFNWTYVSIVVSDNEYGRNGLIALGKILKVRKFCIAEEASFSTQADVDEIVEKLRQYDKQHVILLWCQRPRAIQFLKAATGKLVNVTWIGTESWGDSENVRKEVSFDLIGGMLGVIPYLARHEKFDMHLRSLTPKSKTQNPWLHEYWQVSGDKCALLPNDCPDKDLPNAYSLPPNKYTNVMDAVYAIAYGLQELQKSHPNLNVSRLDKDMLAELISKIKENSFPALSTPGKFEFTKNGDPNFGAYTIKNLQGDLMDNKFVSIAQWDGQSSKLQFIQNATIQWNTYNNHAPRSRCSETCEAGFGIVRSNRECCWSCPKCQAGYFKPNVGNEPCRPCKYGYMSNSDRTGCIKMREDYLRWDSPFSIVTMVFCFVGLAYTLFTIAVFRRYSTTAVVKASNREVSIVHLTSHALLFLLPLMYIGRPKAPTCVMRVILFPVLFTFITAIMFLKTDRIVRIFNSKARLTKRSRLLSNKVQFVLTAMLTLIPLIGTSIWLILRPLNVSKEQVEDYYIVYCENEQSCQMVQLSYILLLALLCTYEAFHARKLPESFNEAKFICFSMFAFVMLWLGYIPVCVDVTGSTRQFMACLFILLINMLTALLIYVPKLNIILLRPESNRHESFKKPSQSSGPKETRRLSPVGTPSTSREPKTSLEINEENGNKGNNNTPGSERKVQNVNSRSNASYGSNEQLVAHHLGLPDARRSSIPFSNEFDNVFPVKPVHSL